MGTAFAAASATEFAPARLTARSACAPGQADFVEERERRRRDPAFGVRRADLRIGAAAGEVVDLPAGERSGVAADERGHERVDAAGPLRRSGDEERRPARIERETLAADAT